MSTQIPILAPLELTDAQYKYLYKYLASVMKYLSDNACYWYHQEGWPPRTFKFGPIACSKAFKLTRPTTRKMIREGKSIKHAGFISKVDIHWDKRHKIVSLLRKGKTLGEVADDLKIHPQTVSRVYCKATGTRIKGNFQRKREVDYTKEEIRYICTLRDEHRLTWDEIIVQFSSYFGITEPPYISQRMVRTLYRRAGGKNFTQWRFVRAKERWAELSEKVVPLRRQGMSYKVIARKLGSTTYDVERAYKLVAFDDVAPRLRAGKEARKHWKKMYKEYFAEGTLADVAEKYRISTSTLLNIFREHKLKLRGRTLPPYTKEEIVEMHRLYDRENLSREELRCRFGISTTTFVVYCTEFGLPLRTLDERRQRHETGYIRSGGKTKSVFKQK